MRTCLLGLVLAFAAVASAQQTPPPAGRPVRSGPAPTSQPAKSEPAEERRPTLPRPSPSKALESVLPEVVFDETPLDLALDSITRSIDTDFMIHWRALAQARVDRRTPITMRLRDVSGREALQAVLRLATVDEPLGFEVSSTGVVISAMRELDSALQTQVYVITDLIMVSDALPLPKGFSMGFDADGEAPSADGAAIRPQQEGDPRGMVHSNPNISREIRVRQIIDCIVSLEPTHFEEFGGPGRVGRFRDYLVVRAAPRIHQLIGAPVRVSASPASIAAPAPPQAQPNVQ